LLSQKPDKSRAALHAQSERVTLKLNRRAQNLRMCGSAASNLMKSLEIYFSEHERLLAARFILKNSKKTLATPLLAS
jgi:hypothetical protein